MKSEVLEIYKSLQNISTFSPQLLAKNFPPNANSEVRPNSVCVEDALCGDSGKGSVVAKYNKILSARGLVFSLRYNGGGNAGHETYVNGQAIVTHQLPTAVIQEGATALITRGMVVHPEDLITEINQVKAYFNGDLPGNLLIDERTLLALDTHRALETTFNIHTTGGRGSTGRGIATAYASLYERHPVTMRDLLSPDWTDKLSTHYHLYQEQIAGLGQQVAEMSVATLDTQNGGKRLMGTETEFISRLANCRDELKPFTRSDTYDLLQKAWNDPHIPFTIEGAQGPGLDPYHGVYPDITASRPMSRNINDATYNVVLPEEIQLRLAVMKTTYMSSVGTRRLPTQSDPARERWIQQEFDERGRSTGRLRDICLVSVPFIRYLRRAAGYHFLVATHLDASRPDETIKVISHYTDKTTGEEKPYLPYQDELDKLTAHCIEFKGWDGGSLRRVRGLSDLPEETIRYLYFLQQTVAPIVMATTGPGLDEYIPFLQIS